MKTASEKVEALHERARLIRKARDKTIISTLGTISILMLVGIIILTGMMEGEMHPVGDTGKLGSSLLFEGAGGYVLTAVISFTAAMVITVLCIKMKNRKDMQSEENERTGGKQK